MHTSLRPVGDWVSMHLSLSACMREFAVAGCLSILSFQRRGVARRSTEPPKLGKIAVVQARPIAGRASPSFPCEDIWEMILRVRAEYPKEIYQCTDSLVYLTNTDCLEPTSALH
jgi:hypothetical protein